MKEYSVRFVGVHDLQFRISKKYKLTEKILISQAATAMPALHILSFHLYLQFLLPDCM